MAEGEAEATVIHDAAAVLDDRIIDNVVGADGRFRIQADTPPAVAVDQVVFDMTVGDSRVEMQTPAGVESDDVIANRQAFAVGVNTVAEVEVGAVVFDDVVLDDRSENVMGLDAVQGVVVNAAIAYHGVIGVGFDTRVFGPAALEAVDDDPGAAAPDINIVKRRAVQDGFVLELGFEDRRLLRRAGVFRRKRDLNADIVAGLEDEGVTAADPF